MGFRTRLSATVLQCSCRSPSKREFGKTLSVESGGALLANGTVAQPVTFTSGAASPAAGDWNKITFLSTAEKTSLLDHLVVEYGGANVIEVNDGASVGLSTVVVRHTTDYGIYSTVNGTFSQFDNVAVTDAYPLFVGPAQLGMLGSFSASGCGHDQVLVTAGSASKAATWKNFGIPYHFGGTSGGTFTLLSPITVEAGTSLLFDTGKYLDIGAGGSLKANGTATQPITIGSSLAVPVPGSWNRITLYPTALGDSVLKYTAVKDAASAALTLNGSQLALDHATFTGNMTCDVKVVPSATLLTSAGGNIFTACP
jgi:hypothetical protein